MKKGRATTLDIFKENSKSDIHENEAVTENGCQSDEDCFHEKLKANGVVANKKTSYWHLSKNGVTSVRNSCRKISDHETPSKSSFANTIRRTMSETNILEEVSSPTSMSSFLRNSGKKKSKRKDSKIFHSLRERTKNRDKVEVQKKHSFDSRSSMIWLTPTVQRISSGSTDSSGVDVKYLDDVFTDDVNSIQVDLHSRENSLDNPVIRRRENKSKNKTIFLDARKSFYGQDGRLGDQDESLKNGVAIGLSERGKNDNDILIPEIKVPSCTIGIQTEISFGNWFFHKHQHQQQQQHYRYLTRNNQHINTHQHLQRSNSL